MGKVNGVMLRGKGRWYMSVYDGKGEDHPCFKCDLGGLCKVPPGGARFVGLCSELLGDSTGKFRPASLGDVLAVLDGMV